MDYETLTVQKDQGIGIITFNRPDRMNSLSTKMFEELSQSLADVATDRAVRVVILTGNGRAFCAGADLNEGIILRSTSETAGRGLTAELEAEFKELHKTVLAFRQMNKPIIGAINGDAVGAGFSLALACDMRIVSEKARFGMVFSRVGLVTDFGGSYFLPRVVGTAKACELIMTGDIFDAAEANRLGLCNKVVAPDALMPTALELARRIADGPPLAIAMSKGMIYKEVDADIMSALDYESAMQAIAMQTADHIEGVKAFREKRKPAFQGR